MRKYYADHMKDFVRKDQVTEAVIAKEKDIQRARALNAVACSHIELGAYHVDVLLSGTLVVCSTEENARYLLV